MSNHENNSAKQNKSTLSGIEGLVKALARAQESDSFHYTERLKSPQSTNFGNFTEKLTYPGSVNIAEELTDARPVGTLLAALETSDGRKRIVHFGKREDTTELLKDIPAIGYISNRDGEYVMYIGEDTALQTIVLDAHELPRATDIGGELTFGDQDKPRKVEGVVQKIVSFR